MRCPDCGRTWTLIGVRGILACCRWFSISWPGYEQRWDGPLWTH